MDKYKFTLRTDVPELNGRPIGRFDAFIPDVDADNIKVEKADIYGYIQIEGALLKTSCNGGNASVFIRTDAVAESTKAHPREIKIEKATENAFFWYKLWHDATQKTAFIGLLLAIAGVLIDTGFAIGKVHVFFTVSYEVSLLALVIAFLLKVAGLWLVFKKGLREAK